MSFDYDKNEIDGHLTNRQVFYWEHSNFIQRESIVNFDGSKLLLHSLKKTWKKVATEDEERAV